MPNTLLPVFKWNSSIQSLAKDAGEKNGGFLILLRKVIDLFCHILSLQKPNQMKNGIFLLYLGWSYPSLFFHTSNGTHLYDPSLKRLEKMYLTTPEIFYLKIKIGSDKNGIFVTYVAWNCRILSLQATQAFKGFYTVL